MEEGGKKILFSEGDVPCVQCPRLKAIETCCPGMFLCHQWVLIPCRGKQQAFSLHARFFHLGKILEPQGEEMEVRGRASHSSTSNLWAQSTHSVGGVGPLMCALALFMLALPAF